MDLREITPLLITLDERDNIERTLAALAWASRIVVVDSGSTDGTLEILNANPRVEVVHRSFDSFARQCAFGLARVTTPYVLSLDADHVLTPELVRELEVTKPGDYSGWEASFRYCICGKPLHASLLPPRVVLFRTRAGVFENVGHAHRVRVDGSVGRLAAPILHDDRKPLARWLEAQARYARQESEKLMADGDVDLPDRLRRWHLAPLLILPYCLLACGLVFSGWRGLFYSVQRLYFEVLLTLFLLERRLSRK